MHGLFVTLGFEVAAFFPFFAIYLQRRGLSESEIGLVIAFMACSRILLNPVWGHLADTRMGRLSALQWGLLGTSLCAFSMNALHGVIPIAIGGFGIAGFMVATGPNIDTIALEHLGEARMSQYGKIRGWLSLSYAGACLVIGSVLQANDIRLAMPIFALAGLGCLPGARRPSAIIPSMWTTGGWARWARCSARRRDSGDSLPPSRWCGRASTPRGTSSR